MKLDFWAERAHYSSRWNYRDLQALLFMFALVAVCACASAKLSSDAGNVTSIWVSNGVISAFILTAPKHRRLPHFAIGILENIVIGIALGNTLPSECWFDLCNSVEVLITVLPLRQFSRADILNKRAVCRLVYFGLFLGPLAAGLLAAPALRILQGEPFLQGLRVWSLGDALGSAASLPLVLLIMTRGTTRERRTAQSAAEKAAGATWLALLVAVAFAVFGQTSYPISFLLFPPLVALIFRLRMTGAVIGTSIVVAIAAAFTAEGHGPFALNAATSITGHVLLFQVFGLIVFASCFPLGLVIEERRCLEDELRLANGKLSELALRDGLTGVLNRRSLDEILEAAWSSAAAHGRELSLVYLDIDFFKRFIDAYGHQSGDDCLRRVARSLVENVRRSEDCVARYGGEEFVIVLAEVSESSARSTAERITEAIQELKIPHIDSPFGVITASFGIATVRPSSGGSPSWLVHLADDALYAAKRGGRNRIETCVTSASRECVLN